MKLIFYRNKQSGKIEHCDPMPKAYENDEMKLQSLIDGYNKNENYNRECFLKELTEEQLKQLGVISKPKASIEDDIVKIGEYEFIVLEKGDGVLKLLLKEMLCASKFGENNNFKGSEVEKVLAEFACKIANIVGEENLVEHTVDLTSDDGLKDYGTTEAKMSLLTCDMYRKYVYVLDEHKVDRWWWLATAYSTPTHDDDTWIKCVSPSGYIGNSGYYDGYGVRPFCILKSHIFES